MEDLDMRFKLYGEFDGRLIAQIIDQANGGSENDAGRFLMRYWLENERQHISAQSQILTPERHQSDAGTSDTDGDLKDRAAGLAEDWQK